MSHFLTVVLIPPDTKDVDDQVKDLLAPYDEEIQVAPYEQPCYCVGREARHACRDQMDQELPWPPRSIDVTPEERAIEETLEEQREAKYLELLAAHPDREMIDPTCSECNGSGKNLTRRNPSSKWDWWQIGGRWSGWLSEQDPEADPDNWEVCTLCSGSGKRPRGREDFGEEWEKATNGCNGCKGTGKSLKWPTRWKDQGNIVPVSVVLQQLADGKKGMIPFAIVTPDGRWFEKGEMGWWAAVSNKKKQADWGQEVAALYQKYADHTAVAVDCHI